jgi:molybdopterin-guanine dinucleotide biosynthesis protein A
MGQDKAFTALRGRPLVSYPVQALTAAGASEVLTVGGDVARLSALGLQVVADDHPGCGPLGGVITGLEHAREPTVVVLGCDQPAMTAAAIDELLERLWAADADAVVPLVTGRRTAVGAAYRARALEPLRAAFDSGERSLRRGIEALSVEVIEPGDADAFVDVDSPDELRRYAASDRGRRRDEDETWTFRRSR